MACCSLKRFKDCKTLREWEECYWLSSPSLNALRGLFTSITMLAFSDSSRMANDDVGLGCLTWNIDPIKSPLSISAGSVQDPGDTQNVPGVLISMGEQGVQLQSVGHSALGSMSLDFARGNWTRLATVSVNFVCRHQNADIACLMSDYMLMCLTAIESKLRDERGWIRNYNPVSQTEPKLTSLGQEGNSNKWYESVVTVQVEYEYRVQVAEESKLMKDFSVYTEAKQDPKTISN